MKKPALLIACGVVVGMAIGALTAPAQSPVPDLVFENISDEWLAVLVVHPFSQEQVSVPPNSMVDLYNVRRLKVDVGES